MQKELFYQFLEYLRNKQDVYVDELTVSAGLFALQTDNRTDDIRRIVKAIRKALTLQAAYTKAYSSLMNYARQSNPCWKEQPDLLFFEDVYELLLLMDCPKDKADEYTRTIAVGNFGSKWDTDHEYRKLFREDGDLLHWAKSTKWLPHRSMLAKLLPTEYDNYLHECHKSKCEYEELPGLNGNMFSGSRYMYHKIQYAPEAALNFPHNQLSITCGILVLPTTYTDAERLYHAANEWFPYKSEKGLFENVVSVGLFCGGNANLQIRLQENSQAALTLQPDDSHSLFGKNSLCICTTALKCDSLKRYCENILADLGIPTAYLKDGFNLTLYRLNRD